MIYKRTLHNVEYKSVILLIKIHCITCNESEIKRYPKKKVKHMCCCVIVISRMYGRTLNDSYVLLRILVLFLISWFLVHANAVYIST